MRPPIPPRREPTPPAAPPSAPGQPDRLDALARQLEQQGDLLASAVTTQSQQLVAQQRLLQDVVQGLLFVGAKAGRGGAVAGSAAATACTAAAAPAPASAAAAARPPRPPASRDAQHSADAAALAAAPSPGARAALAARLRQQVLADGGAGGGSGSEDEAEPDGEALQPAGVSQLPFGVLRVPPLPGRDGLGGLGRRGADLVRPLASRAAGAALQGTSSRRPAWDDRTVVPAPQHGRRAAAGEDSLAEAPTRRSVGGLAPELLLAELQRLQRRRPSGGGTARRSLAAPLQQANRPLGEPEGWQGTSLHAGGGSQLLLRAKVAAATAPVRRLVAHAEGRSMPAAAVAPARGASLCPDPAAGAARQPAAAGASSTAGGERAGSPAKRRAVPAAEVAPLGPCTLDRAEQPLPELSDWDIDVLCDSLLREMLLEECAPCAPA